MSSPLNPLSGKAPGGDSSTFMTVAGGLLHGKIPYVDFFENKGPLIFIIDWFGLLIGGFTGVWLTEFVLMFISVLFAFKTARLFAGRAPSFVSTGLAFLILTRFFEGGNLTEEYALPFIFIALYKFTAYYFNAGKDAHSNKFITIGACLGATLMLRPNMFSLWNGFLFVLFVGEVWRKEYRTLFKEIMYLAAGVAVALAPVFAYLVITSSLDECIEQYILYNFLYTAAGEGVPCLNVPSLALSMLHAVNNAVFPLIISVIWLLIEDRRKPRYGYFAGYALSLLISFLLLSLSRRGFAHYNMVLVPFYVPAFAYGADKFFGMFRFFKHRATQLLIPTLLVLLFFNRQVSGTMRGIYALTKSETKKECATFGQEIDRHTCKNSTISVLGYSCWVYLYTQCQPASKYIYQYPVEISESRRDEFISDISNRHPDIIVVPLTNGVCDGKYWHKAYSQVFSFIEESYEELFTANGYVVFKHQ
jgi:hypothetical protein